MVFTRLSSQEKEAFFGLLDEYFASRPEVLGGKGVSPAAAASVVQRLAANASPPGRSNNPYAGIAASAGSQLATHQTSVFSALKKAGAPGVVAIPPAFGAPREEWAQALYEYRSEDPGDLAIEAGARVLVTAKSSEDWWTGRIDGQGKEGLFPASYVKLL